MTRQFTGLRPFFIVAFLLGLLPVQTQAAEPFQINAILPLTGYGAFVGKGEAAALGVVEETVNRQGGINGRPIKFAILDDQSDPQLAVQLTNAQIANKVPVIFGSTLSGNCNAMLPLLKDGPVAYCFSPSIHPATGSFMFSAGATTVDHLIVIARYFRARGWHKVAVLTPTDSAGQDADHAFTDVLAMPENKSLVLASRQYFNVSDVSIAAQLNRIKASGADVLFTWATGTPQGTLLRGVIDVGLNIPIISSPGNLTYAQMKQYAAFLPPELYFPGNPSFAYDQLSPGPVKRAVAEYLDSFKLAGIKPDIADLFAWNSAMIVIDAFRRLGTGASAQQIRTFIANYRGAGASGPLDFHATPQRGIGSNSIMMLRWDAAKATWIGVSSSDGKVLR